MNDHLPDVPFPPLPEDDLGIHPQLGISVSKTRILLRFTDMATVLQANAAIQARDVEILGAIPDLGVVLVGVPDVDDQAEFPGFEFLALSFALQILDANPAVETAACRPSFSAQVVPRQAEAALVDGATSCTPGRKVRAPGRGSGRQSTGRPAAPAGTGAWRPRASRKPGI